MIVALLLLALSRPYWTIAPKDFPTSRHTHVCTSGKVTVLRMEQDGDRHIRLVDGGAFIIAEIIPGLPVAGADRIRKGQRLTVCGIRRFDDEHGWWECHPVERLGP